MELPLVKEWSTYNYNDFPEVFVKMKGKITNDDEFNSFCEKWYNLYEKNQDFTLIFDTTEVGFVSMKYAFKMRNFIRKLKREKKTGLEKSVIIVKTSWVRNLLRLIFFLESPVAPVYVVTQKTEFNFRQVLEDIENNNLRRNNITYYKP